MLKIKDMNSLLEINKIKELRKRGFEGHMVLDNYGYCLAKQYKLDNTWYEIMINKKGYVDIINHSNNNNNVINITLLKEFVNDLKFIIDNLEESDDND